MRLYRVDVAMEVCVLADEAEDAREEVLGLLRRGECDVEIDLSECHATEMTPEDAEGMSDGRLDSPPWGGDDDDEELTVRQILAAMPPKVTATEGA